MTESLTIENLTVRFGGLVAVDSVDLEAPIGQITGLIGPNGAGKTTTFNACSGLQRATAGTVRLGATDLTNLSVQRRCQRGLGRTFQRMELFESLTVRENVSIGREALISGSYPWGHLFSSKSDRAAVDEATSDAIAVCGLENVENETVSALSTGVRRLVELARAVAGQSRLLLLDEPSSGIDHSETDRFGNTLLDLVRDRGVGILLVEHDMDLVMRVCDRIHVLDFGKKLFEGTPAEVRESDVVRRAYLGTDS